MKNEKRYPTVSLFLILPAIIVTAIIRFVLVLSGIDFETGFFAEDMNWLAWLCYILWILFGIAFCGAAVLEKRGESRFFKKRMSKLTELQALIIGILALAAAAAVFIDIVGMFSNGLDFSFVISAIGFVGYLCVGLVILGNKRIMPLGGHLMIILSAYYTIKAAKLFMDKLIITRVSDLLINLLVYLLLALFFLACGRIFARNEAKLTRLKALIFGCSAVMLTFSQGISAILFNLFAPENVRTLAAESEIPFTPTIEFYISGLLVLMILVSISSRRVALKK